MVSEPMGRPPPGILVIDDDGDLRETMRDVLEAEGYQVTVASNGRDALEHLRHAPLVDLILLDLAMPVMNGVELCAALAEDASRPHIPIIVFTAGRATTSAELAEHIDAYLQKPVGLDDLLQCVSRFSGLRRA